MRLFPARIAICLLLIGLLPTVSASAQSARGGAFAETERTHEAQENVGLAAVLMQNHAIRSEQYLGLAVVEYDLEVTPHSRFQVMSVTKAFLGAALIKSVSAGLVDLDAPIQVYIPEFPAPAHGVITLRNLASHTSGLAHFGHPDRREVYVQHFEDARSVLNTFQDRPFAQGPDEGYVYSSSGYNLIAAVLEVVHDKPIRQILRELVFDPLGLDDTEIGDVMRPTANLVRNYSYVDIWSYQPSEVLQQVPTWDFSFNPGGGNIITTARDLARFGDAFLAPGYFTEQELALLTTRINPELSTWGFGWFVNDDGTISISGATPGVQAGLMVDPRHGVVMAVLANAWGRGSAGGELVVGAPRRDLENWIREH